MTNEQFENLITNSVEALPKNIREKMNNVEIVMEEGESPNNSLYGLYHGVSQLHRAAGYGVGGVLPDKITIYKGTIERFALRQAHDLRPNQAQDLRPNQAQDLRPNQAHDLRPNQENQTPSTDLENQVISNLVRRVVWHEIAHHFGFNEESVRKLEEKWAAENKI